MMRPPGTARRALSFRERDAPMARDEVLKQAIRNCLPALAGIAVTVCGPAPADGSGLAQAGCGQRAAMVDRLSEDFGEHPTAFGLADFGHVVEVLVSADGGTWTILVTRSDGVSCIAAAGRHWQEPAKKEIPGRQS